MTRAEVGLSGEGLDLQDISCINGCYDNLKMDLNNIFHYCKYPGNQLCFGSFE